MVRMSRHSRVIFEIAVTAYAHQIRLVAKFQGCLIQTRLSFRIMAMRIVAVGIMASATAYLSLPEALRTFKRFHNERGLAKPAVLVETLTGEISERNPGILAEKMIGGQII